MTVLDKIINFNSLEGNKELLCESLCKDIMDCNNPSYVMSFIEENRVYIDSYFLEYYDDLKDYGIIKESSVIDRESRELLKQIQHQKIVSESTRDDKYFFLSTKNMNKKTLTPRIPTNCFTEAAYEDMETKRVSLFDSIEDNLKSMKNINEGAILYVHAPAHDIKVHTPSAKQLPYRLAIKEEWCQKPVTLKCIGKIKVIKPLNESTGTFMYGDPTSMKRATYNNWNYEWIENYKECAENSFKPAKLSNESYLLNNEFFQTKDSITFFSEALESNAKLKKMLYQDRIRQDKDLYTIYDSVREQNPFIKYTFIRPDRYKNRNVFIDMRFYNESFMKNNLYKNIKGAEIYFDLIVKLLNTRGFEDYKRRTVFIDIDEYLPIGKGDIWNYKENTNPISTLFYMMPYNPAKIRNELKGYTFVFFGQTGYFKMDIKEKTEFDRNRFRILINKLIARESITDNDTTKDSPKAIKTDLMDRVQKAKGIKVHSLTGEDEVITPEELEKKKANNAAKSDNAKKIEDKIDQVSKDSESSEEAIDKLDQDEEFKQLLLDLAAEEEEKSQVSATRAARMTKLNNEFKTKQVGDKTVKELLDSGKEVRQLPETPIPVDSINDEWEHIKFQNFNKIYDNDEDIMMILEFFSTRTNPIAVRNITKEDTSTTEDSVYTYTVQCEDANGNRFKLVFDVPKLRNDRFMKIGGNEKTISGQLPLLPIIKTDNDTVQIVSNYNKIFIRRFGTSAGKSSTSAGRLIKALSNYSGSVIKATPGDASKICNKYELPIDYVDLSSAYSKITYHIDKDRYVIYFNQDELRSKFNVNEANGVPLIIKNDKDVIYWSTTPEYPTLSKYIVKNLCDADAKFSEIYNETKPSKKYTYSKASILNTEIPVVVVMGYSAGLYMTLQKANIKYDIVEKKPKYDPDEKDVIRFNDGYLIYDLDYNSSLLMNGLKECDTENYSIKDINSKIMWLDFLDLFGGRIKADGLDNFYDLMMDPITEEVCKDYGLPYKYLDVLAYSNMLLADNKYNKHVDLDGNRYRCKELVSDYVYKALARSYGQYSNMLKRSKKDAVMSIKRTQIIDDIMADPTAGDLSIFSPLLEVEAANSVSFKGISGMNSDRSYGLDKRTFDKTMINKLGMSTGFAGNVGLTRQATINMAVDGKRGYMKDSSKQEMNDVNTLCITEALTPMGTTRDDPFRTAMTFIQTNKHNMKTKVSTPLLVTNGADEALAYMCSDMFAYKAKDKGEVVEATDEYLIVKYSNGETDFVDLRENVKKNSDGGFFGVLKLDSDLKVGDKVKPGEIMAYDRESFSKQVGQKANPQYNIGVLSKIAILNTDEGYEDSAIISDWLSRAMTSEVVVKVEKVLPKNTNILSMVKKGQPIQEGEPLMIFQNAFSEDDLNSLLKNLADDEDDISDLGRVRVKSKVTGIVQDIVIYRTVEKDELSDSLKKYVTEYESRVTKIKKIADKCDNDTEEQFTANYKLEPSGKLKGARDGVLIEFYLKYEDQMSVGVA